MREFHEYVQLRLQEDPEQAAKASELLEELYFERIRPWHRRLRSSNEYKAAIDLVHVKRSLETKCIDLSNIKSDLVRRLLDQQELSRKGCIVLTRDQILQIRGRIVAPYRYYVTALFVADVIAVANRTEYIRFMLNLSLSLLVSLLALASSIAGAVLGWDWIVALVESTAN